jgi:hypothetical protein
VTITRVLPSFWQTPAPSAPLRQIDGFANLTARIRRMILFIDGGAFHLQEEPFSLLLSRSIAFSVICASVGTEASRFGFGVQVTAGLSILP